MPWYEHAGQRLYYEDHGRGDTVLLLPGWAGSVIEFNRLRTELAEGFRILAVDLPGSGRSQPQPRRYRPDFYHHDAATLLKLLEDRGVDAAHLVGFSDGGETALVMAGTAPRRALSVLTWGAAGRVVTAPVGLDTVVDDPIDSLKQLAAYLAESYGVDNARAMAASWGQALSDIIAEGGDVAYALAPRIACPALLLTGTYDPYCPPEAVRFMAAAIPGGRFLEVTGAGHDVHRSHPAWFRSAVESWLSEH